MERSIISNGKTHYKSQFSIAMFNYQRVPRGFPPLKFMKDQESIPVLFPDPVPLQGKLKNKQTRLGDCHCFYCKRMILWWCVTEFLRAKWWSIWQSLWHILDLFKSYVLDRFGFDGGFISNPPNGHFDWKRWLLSRKLTVSYGKSPVWMDTLHQPLINLMVYQSWI